MDGKTIIAAFTHILYQLVYFLFILPFDVWSKTIQRLAAQRENKALKYTEINSPWPMFTFLKRWCIDFFFDMLIAIGWILALYYFISNSAKLIDYILGFFISYFCVVVIAWLRDFFVLLIKPFSKFLGWLKKPAQHLDLTIDKELL